jgi:hypothetical protein
VRETPDLSRLALHLRTPVYRYHQHQGDTNDCGPFSVAIAANAVLGEERFDGRTVAREMNRPAVRIRPFPHAILYRVRDGVTFPWGIVHYLRQHGIPARWSPFGTLSRLRRSLVGDQITLVMVAEPLRWQGRRYAGWAHVKIPFGYAADRGFVFVDPALAPDPDAPDRWRRHGLGWQREEAFLREWRWLFRTYVEVGQVVRRRARRGAGRPARDWREAWNERRAVAR